MIRICDNNFLGGVCRRLWSGRGGGREVERGPRLGTILEHRFEQTKSCSPRAV